jgi:exodeoxyribonuclease-3
MKIATWNINGSKARIDGLVAWLAEARPDVVCLQEIKTVDEGFPVAEVQALGYHAAVHGQKGFNGVAVLSLAEPVAVSRGLPGNPDDVQSRFIEATFATAAGPLTVAGLYLPNGNPIGTEKFSYKLAWMDRLERHAAQRLGEETLYLMVGDYNVIPQPIDARHPNNWLNDALFQPESRASFRRLETLGFVDAVRAASDAALYTFWDYQAGAWQKNDGIRIDHCLLSPLAADRLTAVGIDRHVRGWEKPSDHVPVWVELSVGAP